MMKQWQLRKAAGKKGFTLIELIVVMAILAILAMLLVPMIGTYTKKARDATGEANARAVYAAAAAWAADEMAQNDGISDNELNEDDLEEYFSNTGKHRIGAKVRDDGAVTDAWYDDYHYPKKTS